MYAIITPQAQYGNFAWCGNQASSGTYLSRNIDRGFCSYPDKKILITLNVELSDELTRVANKIMVYDPSGFLAHYNTRPLSQIYSGKFQTHEKFQGQELTVEIGHMADRKFIEIVSYKITIPILKVLGDASNCAICIEPIAQSDYDTNVYISPCAHIFHSKCIFEYLELSGNISEPCWAHCTHGPKPKDWTCPICRYKIKS